MDNQKKIKLDRPEFLCTHCSGHEVERVSEYFPWSEAHWACPNCHSTYAIWIYPKLNFFNRLERKKD